MNYSRGCCFGIAIVATSYQRKKKVAPGASRWMRCFVGGWNGLPGFAFQATPWQFLFNRWLNKNW
jgi:hypothetical protein